MATCPSGTRAKSTSPTFFTYEQADILAAIPTFGAWLSLHVLGLPVLPTETASFCSIQPTGDLPLITDWPLLAFPPAAAFFGAYERLRNQIIAWKFNDLCECSPGAGGTCSVGWAPSATTTNRRSTGGSAFEFGTKFTVSAGCTLYGVDTWFSDPPQSSVVIVTVWDELSGSNVGGQAFTYAGSGYHRYLFTTPVVLTSGRTYQVSHCAAAGVFVSDMSAAPANAGLLTFADKQYAFVCGSHPVSSAGAWPCIGPIVCTGGPPGTSATPVGDPPRPPIPIDFPTPPAGPTCASYQDVCNELAVLFREIQSLEANLTIVRQTQSPEATSFGTPHPGLTGHGTIAVVGILGCSVTLTSVPSTWGFTLETPRRLIPKAGAIHFSDGSHNTDEAQVHYDSQLVANAPTYTTQIVYNFRPGITGTITPLLISAPV